MRRSVYTRLAATNIKKNRGTYIPYMLTCILCIAMLYMMFFIKENDGIDGMIGGEIVRLIMNLGIVVVGIFSFVFLLYSNSFVMKQRQKEIGLYNILGMEKGHIARMMLVETVMTSVISMLLGIGLGILGSKLALLLLLKLIHIPAMFGFTVYGAGIVRCCLLFGTIFFLTLLSNLRRVQISRPIELLQGNNTGEREPKTKLFMALLGFVCLGGGYYIAITTASPLDALVLFFLAVLLVMAGTYLLFTAGSILVLKIMRRTKGFYYRTRNFTAVSGMLYRMKQNAVGLSNICILSTGVLLMISTTVSLNYGFLDLIKVQYPYDVEVGAYTSDLEESGRAMEGVKKVLEEMGGPQVTQKEYCYLTTACQEENGAYVFNQSDKNSWSYEILTIIPQETYTRLSGENPALTDGQVLLYREEGALEGTLTIMDSEFQIAGSLEKWPLPEDPDPALSGNNHALIVTDNDFEKINAIQKEVFQEVSSHVLSVIGIDVEGNDKETLAYARKVDEAVTAYAGSAGLSEGSWFRVHIREDQIADGYSIYGSFLFLGLFLGGLFLVGTAMIIYYKQISEGYEDKERFEIMRKVGMSRREVKASIRRQILMIFFLPLLMAVAHIAAAFPMVQRLLFLFSLYDTWLFALCTVITILIFAVVYGVIYALTARAYYRILEKAE